LSSGESPQAHVWPEFEDALARIRRKYPHIDEDIKDSLKDGPKGRMDALPGYSHKLWKYRIGIYAKSERADVPSDELLRLWKRFLEHLKTLRNKK